MIRFVFNIRVIKYILNSRLLFFGLHKVALIYADR